MTTTPAVAGDLLESVLRPHGTMDIILMLREQWKAMFTGRAATARPIMIVDQCLVLAAPTWGDVQIVRYNTQHIINTVNTLTGATTITRLRFKVLRQQ